MRSIAPGRQSYNHATCFNHAFGSLRPPVADSLRNGIHELRPSYAGVHYRILYFLAGRDVVVVSQGLIKEARVPAVDIERAIVRRKKFAENPGAHTMGTEW